MPQGMKPGVAVAAEAEARRKIEHKLKVLERWRNRGVPEGLSEKELPPPSLTKFASWTVSKSYYGLAPVEYVGRSTVLTKNRDLTARAKTETEYWAAKRRQPSTRRSREGELNKVRADRAELESQRTLLLSQWTSERHERLAAERREADLRTTNRHLTGERDVLRGEVSILRTQLGEALAELDTLKRNGTHG